MFKEISRIDKTLRPYQQDAKENIFSAWDEVDNVMFQMPTGTGKTRLFTSIISDIKTWGALNSRDVKIMIIAHRVELIEQISESLDKYKIPHGLIAGGKERDLRQYVQVASIQTLTHHSNISAVQELNVDFVIIDEAHHSMANSYHKLWDIYGDAKKLGVTATPWRMNNSGFSSIYDRIILSKPIKDFIAEGWLSPYEYYSISNSSNLKEKINAIDEFDIEGDYKTSALERVMDNASIRAQLLKSYETLAKGKKGIIYSISRKHSDHICEEFKAAGVNIVRIDSKTPRDERRLYVKRFKEGKIDIIVNVDIFSEGFDCPDIEFIQLARPTKSLVKYLQQVGRGLRPTTGKTRCVILDNVGLHFNFGLPDSIQDWQLYFDGESKVSTTNRVSRRNAEGVCRERSFEEGNDEMSLISETEVNIIEDNSAPISETWSEKDSMLLSTLFFEKKCDISVISQVFGRPVEFITEKINELKFDK